MSYYTFSDLAIDDIEQICDFLAQTNPKFARQLFDTIRQKCKLVAGFPNMGKDYSWIDPNLRGFFELPIWVNLTETVKLLMAEVDGI